MTTIDGCGVTALPFEAELRHFQRAGKTAEFVVDEDAADIVLFEQRLDRALRQFLVVVRQIDQVRSAIGGDHEVGLGGIIAEQAVAGLRMGAVGHARVLVVGIEQRQIERLGEIDAPGSPSAGNPSACRRS